MSGGRVYAAISAITADIARTGIAKSSVNTAEQYAYRSIDDVCAKLAPLLAQHRLCILPRVLERSCEEVTSSDGSVLLRVALRVAFDLVSARDGSSHVIETYGEAVDGGDKATAKAMSGAYKHAVLQTFCVPVQGSDDAEATTHRLKAGTDTVPDPVQGWQQWSLDVQDLVRGCETCEALDRVQNTYKPQLRAAAKRQPDLYASIGEIIQARRRALAPETPALQAKRRSGANQAAELADA